MAENRIRVLLIEDTLADAQLIQRMLAKSKLPVFDVTHVIDLHTSLKALASANFDAVLLDLGLPDSTGVSTVYRLRSAHPALPIVVLTVTQTPQTILNVIKAGAQDYFVKSRLDADDLMHKIIDAVTRRQVLSGGPLAEAAANRAGGKVVRLLVVEDDDADLALLRKMLDAVKLVRFDLLHAPSLNAALKQLDDGVDVVLLDLNLPDSRGTATVRRLRAFDTQVPIVILSGDDDRRTAVHALEEGAQDFLLKGSVDGVLVGQSILRQLKRSAA
jgi:DNA-binding response OmpR family regulator